MATLIKIVAVYAFLAVTVGPFWNMNTNREPWLSISGWFAMSGFAIVLVGAAAYLWQVILI